MQIAELVREKALHLTKEEVPHALTAQVDEIDERRVSATIFVETESQKQILVGKGGRMVREIGTRARPEIEALLGQPGLPRAPCEGAAEAGAATRRCSSGSAFEPAGRDLGRAEDISRRFDELDDPWPEFMFHDAVVTANWGAMRERFAHLQVVLFDADDGERPIGRGQTMPVRWDGTLDGLPGGVDDATLQAVALADGEADTLSAMVASLDPRVRGQGLSRLIIDGMRRAAAAAGLKALIAPVRPTLEAALPARADGALRRMAPRRRAPLRPVAARCTSGSEPSCSSVARRSMTVEGTVAEWEEWAGMAFPESGDYPVQGALVPVEIDRERDRGVYVEPNVWMLHAV